ncbi:MAG: sigma-70 family RNA polymerase sigma factor [Burkholderiales bacterium]
MEREDESALWQTYLASRDAALRAKLIERYLPEVHKLAAHAYARRGPHSPEFGDYLQWARLGLVEAFDRYDPAREAAFMTFAGYRVRGAILNGLERATEGAAQWAHRKELEEERLDSMLEAADDADALERLADVTLGLALGFALEDSGLSATAEGFDPYRVLEVKRLRERLLVIVEALPERERRILKWHYFEHMDFKLIGAALGLSKGRISQLHARALKLMREGLRSIERFDLSF